MNATLPSPTVPAAAPRPSRTTPAQLRGLLRTVGALVVIAGVVIGFAAEYHRNAEKTVAKEATASIVSAQRAKAGLAAMHAAALRGLLGWPDAGKDYDRHRADVTDGLLTATQNVTYADELPPLRVLLHERGRYEREIAAAQAIGPAPDRRKEVLQHVREADDILHGQLLKAADDLDAINTEHLNAAYNQQKRWSLLAQAVVFVAGLVLIGSLGWAQVFLRQRFRRLCSPPLVVATAVAVGFVGFTMYELVVGRTVLKHAKEDAFGSVHLMWQAKADAHDALASSRLRLLETDRDRATAAARRFEATVGRIGDLPPELDTKMLMGQVRERKIPRGFKGYLADELRNQTFTGENEASVAAVQAFAYFLNVEREVCAKPHEAAVKSSIDTGPESLTVAADKLDRALDKVLEINQREFDRAISKGSVLLRWCEYLNPLAMAAVFALTALGLVPRLREYAI